MGVKLRMLRGMFAARKANKQYEKEQKSMSQNPILKPILESKTTRNVAIGGITVGGATVGAMAFLRRMFPDAIPWGPDGDIHILWIAETILAPVVSRLMAKVIDKK